MKARLGELLLERGLISSDQLTVALTEQRKSGERLGRCLVRLGLVDESYLTALLSELLDYRSVDVERERPDPSALAMLPRALALRHRVLPLRYERGSGELVLAVREPQDLPALDEIAGRIGDGVRLQPVLAGANGLERAVERHYSEALPPGESLRALAVTGTGGQLPAPRLIDALLSDAVRQGASDVHLEPEIGYVRFRYRIDGVLQQVLSLHKEHWPALVVRIKVLAGMDIAEQRTPQDGRISINVGGRQVDFRVSTMPTLHGENIVLRVLDRARDVIRLDDLDIDAGPRSAMQQLLDKPEGIVLVTGPTGSGKTTTQFALLSGLNATELNIMTLEDPVEYHLPTARQCSLNETAQINFSSGIRAMLRQDPDVILIGEIRDADTARMALRAAMTGHRVLATLHTVSARAARPRLLDLGVPAELVDTHLAGVIAQRLLRRLCTQCRTPWEPDRDTCLELGLESPPTLYRANGCERCRHTGYRGRLPIMEIWRPGTSAEAFLSLAECGRRRVLAGHTDLKELHRVVGTPRLRAH